ncbi:phage antirepressor [Arthrobacter cryoconiti]|uniref:Phage antirepressor n=1 Tax=Arthrobacter cryoconiti TaxID=748907 RepID=A0ABV8QWQ2_9MICC|nr:BRO family protein [Arthrobacter cryoconiti]MCC9068847.1 phage antirepressor KilAC domain-containing protein [Arthrobacter cryoconiti]
MELTNFNYSGQPVRTVTVDSESWFVASDVAKILGYSATAAMTRRLDDEDKGVRVLHTLGGGQEMTVISEPGLYAAALGSQVAGAKAFKRWVTHEVLPQIRRTGTYATSTLSGAELMAQALIEAHSTMASYRARVDELTPMATAWEKLASATGDYSVRDAAQVLCRDGGIQVGQNRLFKHLRESGRPWLDKSSRPYQWAVDQGLVAEKISSFKFARTNGEEQLAAPQVRISAKGLQRLHKELAGTRELVKA